MNNFYIFFGVIAIIFAVMISMDILQSKGFKWSKKGKNDNTTE